jgi:hypothetical protein
MRFDTLAELSNAQDIHAGSCASTFGYNTGVAVANYHSNWQSHPTRQQNTGTGNPVKFSFTLANAVVSSGSPTLTIAIQGAPDNATWSNIITSEVLSAGTLTSIGGGYLFDLSLPEGPISQYLQAYYMIGGTGGFSSLQPSCEAVLESIQGNRVW